MAGSTPHGPPLNNPMDGRPDYLRLVVEESPFALVVFDSRMRISEWSPAAERIFGYSREEAIGEAFSFMIPENARMQVEGVVRGLYSGEGGRRSRNWNLTRDGRQILCDWHNVTLRNEDGAVVGIASLVEDVTERARAEEREREREALLSMFFSQALVGIYFVMIDRPIDWANCSDREGTLKWVLANQRFTLVNDAFAAQYRTGRETIIGTNPADGYRGDVSTRIDNYRRLFDQGHMQRETIDTRGDQSKATMEGHYFVLRDELGRITGHVGLQVDVTAQRRAREEAMQAQEAFANEARLDALGRLARSVGHQLGNILTPVMSYAELLRGSFEANDERIHDVDEITKAAARGVKLSRRLHGFSRQGESSPVDCDLGRLAFDATPKFRTRLAENIALRVHPATGPIPVHLDPKQLEDAICTLLDNAGNAMAHGGQVEIRTLSESNEGAFREPTIASERLAIIEISDTGHGMSPELAANLFVPFYRVSETKVGTGLGLAEVRRTVLDASGAARAESTPGNGTRIRIAFPIAESRSKGDADSDVLTSSTVIKRGEPVLLIEADENARNATTRLMSSIGFFVEAVANAEEAARAVGVGAHFLVVDWRSLGKDAEAYVTKFAREHPGCGILILLGGDTPPPAKTWAQGVSALVLSKPYRIVDLVGKLRELRSRHGSTPGA